MQNIFLKELPKRMLQECPLCGQNQPMTFYGLTHDIEGGGCAIARDKGYSFCNCRNIFYTDKKNLTKIVYDDDYSKKYDFYLTKNVAEFEIKKFYEIMKQLRPLIASFFEIGAIQDYVLDYVHHKEVKTIGNDIIERKSKHKMIYGDFETVSIDEKFDVIWASHVFEHFIDPITALKKCYSLLNDDGLIYIAMPDVFFLNIEKCQTFDFHTQEHHILWNMNDWIKICEENKFKCIFKERSLDIYKQQPKDAPYFWKQDFKIICQKQQ